MRPTRPRLMPIIAVLAMAVPFLRPAPAFPQQPHSAPPDAQGTRVPPLVDRPLARDFSSSEGISFGEGIPIEAVI